MYLCVVCNDENFACCVVICACTNDAQRSIISQYFEQNTNSICLEVVFYELYNKK